MTTHAAVEGHARRPDSQPRTDRRPVMGKVGVAVALIGVSVLTLAACSTSSKTTSQPSASGAGGSGAGANPAGTGPGGPAASGLAAAITGNTIEVQNATTGQVSVTYTAMTKFTQATTVTPAAIAVGDCLTASATFPGGSSSSAARPTSFTATSITITPSTSGSCAAGFGGGNRSFAGTRPSRAPSGAPTGSGSGGSSAAAVHRVAAFGKVLAVSGSTITLQATARASAGTTTTTTTDTISTTSATTVTTTAAATAAALKVGECVVANGTTDSTGAVAATRIALSTPGPNGCGSGFGGRFGGSSTGGSNG